MLSPIRPLVLGKRTRRSTLPPCSFALRAAIENSQSGRSGRPPNSKIYLRGNILSEKPEGLPERMLSQETRPNEPKGFSVLPWTLLDTAQIPGGEDKLRLMRRGSEFSIMLDDIELMNSRVGGSEEALATLSCGRISVRRQTRILIGGLGMGFTLRAARHSRREGATRRRRTRSASRSMGARPLGGSLRRQLDGSARQHRGNGCRSPDSLSSLDL